MRQNPVPSVTIVPSNCHILHRTSWIGSEIDWIVKRVGATALAVLYFMACRDYLEIAYLERSLTRLMAKETKKIEVKRKDEK
jgi:hypothetical protein